MTARLALLVSLAALLFDAGSLVHRVRAHATDFSVFHRTASAVTAGAGGELYATRDPATGWFRALPPAGILLFLPLARLDAPRAAVVWALVNLMLLAASVALVRRLRDRLRAEDRLVPFPLAWAAALLLVLAGGSLQVGQLSILFVTCWLLFLALGAGPDLLAGSALALPAAIKLYPGLLLAVPGALRRHRAAALGALTALVMSTAIPAAVYGARWRPLTESFVRHELLDPRGRVYESFVAPSPNSQGVDDVLFRYISRALPTEAGATPLLLALGLADLFRAAVLATTAVAALRWRRAGTDGTRRALLMMALWCAALYLMMPGAKARYAIYCYPALLALMTAAGAARARGDTRRARRLTILVVVVAALLLQALPAALRPTGIALAGPLILWLAVLREAPALSSL